ncbi:hypothetical protein BJX63DRAFT_409750 [Aspergillus granulosus]|uniref:Uncharacterized protein n=1 Tax=Aspergillus granulosus TaxID=176169 RepID=A0ABR4H0D5_9EURO
MPMLWSAEANAKLLVGMIAQLKGQAVKLDYRKLAKHMGPECNAKSVMNQFTKLRRQAAEAVNDTGDEGQTDDVDNQTETDAAAKPAPKKRHAGGASGKNTTAKKKKSVEMNADKEEGEAMYADMEVERESDQLGSIEGASRQQKGYCEDEY